MPGCIARLTFARLQAAARAAAAVKEVLRERTHSGSSIGDLGHRGAAVAANNLAWMLAEEGRLDEAMKYATVAAEELPDRAEVQDTLGWVYLRKHLPGHAEASFQRALALAPQNVTYQQHLQQARDAAR